MAKRVIICDGTTVLRFLVERGPQSLDVICRHVLGQVAPVGSQARRNVRSVIGRLIGAGLAERHGRANSSLQNRDAAIFAATEAGECWIAAGKTVTSGANGPRTGVPKKSAGIRQRIWEVLRRKQKATLNDLVEMAWRDGDPEAVKVIDNARKYLTALARAGIVKKLATRAPGFAPSSNGFNRYALLRDLGPRAPLTGRTFVTNPNAPDTEARILYRKGCTP